MDLGTFLLLVFIFCFVWISWSIAVAYKKRFSRNMLLTGTSVGVLAAQFFMAISLGGLKMHDASTAMTFQNDIAPGLFWFGIFILLFCLIKNVVKQFSKKQPVLSSEEIKVMDDVLRKQIEKFEKENK